MTAAGGGAPNVACADGGVDLHLQVGDVARGYFFSGGKVRPDLGHVAIGDKGGVHGAEVLHAGQVPAEIVQVAAVLLVTPPVHIEAQVPDPPLGTGSSQLNFALVTIAASPEPARSARSASRVTRMEMWEGAPAPGVRHRKSV